MKVEKVLIHDIPYYHFTGCEDLKILCGRCCFAKKDKNGVKTCRLPFACEPNGFYTSYHEKPIEIGDAKFVIGVPPPPESDKAFLATHPDVVAELRLTEQSKEEMGEGGKEQEEKAAAAEQQLTERNEERKPGIGKRSYYAFPNGVEAEDICRYLPFNLGNVVKYCCRAGRKDAKKKLEDLRKAMDYLENEIKRMEEDND
jgi:hypothetical protein